MMNNMSVQCIQTSIQNLESVAQNNERVIAVGTKEDGRTSTLYSSDYTVQTCLCEVRKFGQYHLKRHLFYIRIFPPENNQNESLQ